MGRDPGHADEYDEGEADDQQHGTQDSLFHGASLVAQQGVGGQAYLVIEYCDVAFSARWL
jgi:hypothetical protein